MLLTCLIVRPSRPIIPYIAPEALLCCTLAGHVIIIAGIAVTSAGGEGGSAAEQLVRVASRQTAWWPEGADLHGHNTHISPLGS